MCKLIKNLFKRKEKKMGEMNPDYWNNKWPKAPIIYGGRALRGKDDRVGIDVKNFIKHNDEILQRIVSRYRLKNNDPDKTAHNVQKWVVRFLTYKYDNDTAKIPEFWQFPFETIHSKAGDCEDGAILIASLCRVAGVPSYRIKVAAGNVKTAPTAPTGGHAYAIYLANDGEWRILDWCFYEDSRLPISRKPLAKEGGYRNTYKDVWFTFNDEFSWNQKSLMVAGRIANDRAENSTNLMEDTTEEMNVDTILQDVDKKLK